MINKPLAELTDEELEQARSIAVDVDGTLWFWPEPDRGGPKSGETPTPNHALIERLWKWKLARPGRELTVWSGNGREHALSAVRFLGLGHIADNVMSKPTIMFDDHADWFDPQLMVEVPHEG